MMLKIGDEQLNPNSSRVPKRKGNCHKKCPISDGLLKLQKQGGLRAKKGQANKQTKGYPNNTIDFSLSCCTRCGYSYESHWIFCMFLTKSQYPGQDFNILDKNSISWTRI